MPEIEEILTTLRHGADPASCSALITGRQYWMAARATRNGALR